MSLSETEMEQVMKVLLPKQPKALSVEERAVLSDFMEQLGLNQEQIANVLFTLEPSVTPMRMIVDGNRTDFSDRNGRVLFHMVIE
jgi:hypothetical protein